MQDIDGPLSIIPGRQAIRHIAREFYPAICGKNYSWDFLIKNVIAVPTTTVTTMVIGLRIPTSDDNNSFINTILPPGRSRPVCQVCAVLLCTVCFSLKLYILTHIRSMCWVMLQSGQDRQTGRAVQRSSATNQPEIRLPSPLHAAFTWPDRQAALIYRPPLPKARKPAWYVIRFMSCNGVLFHRHRRSLPSSSTTSNWIDDAAPGWNPISLADAHLLVFLAVGRAREG